MKGHAKSVVDFNYSPDSNKIVTCSADKQILMWDALTGEMKIQLK